MNVGGPLATEHRPRAPTLSTATILGNQSHPPSSSAAPGLRVGWAAPPEPTQLRNKSQDPGGLQSFVGGPGHPATMDNFLSMGK